MNRAGVTSALSLLVGCAALWLAAPTRSRALAGARLRLEAGAERSGRTRAPAAPAGGPVWMVAALAQAGCSFDAGKALYLWLASSGLAAGAGGLMGGLGAAVVVGAAALAGPVVAWCLLRRRGADRMEAQLPGAVDAVARALRSGASLRQALAEAAAATPGPLGADLSSVARATDRGATVVAALEGWAEHQPTPGVRLVVSALCLGAETGGAPARAVDGVAATLRQRLAARAEARALATQARVSAAVLAAAPVAFTAVVSVADARTSSFLFRTGAGLVCLAGGLTLDAVGAVWMARLTRIEIDP